MIAFEKAMKIFPTYNTTRIKGACQIPLLLKIADIVALQ